MAEIDRKVPAKMEIRLNFMYTRDDLGVRGGSLVDKGEGGVYHWEGPDGKFDVKDTGDTSESEIVYSVINRSW